MTDREAFTDSYIRALKPQDEFYSKGDPATPGLRIGVYPLTAGSRVPVKAWVYRFRIDGQLKSMTIGHYGTGPEYMSLTDARAKVHALRGERRREGTDPLEQRKEKLRQKRDEREQARAVQRRQDYTVAKLCNDFLDDREKRLRPATWKEYSRQIEKIIKPAVGTVPAAELTAAQIRDVLRDQVEAGNHVQANRVQALFSTIYSWAVERDIDKAADDPTKISTIPYAGFKRAGGAEAPVETYKTPAEIREIFAAMQAAEKMPADARRAIELIFRVGTRVSETVLAEISEFKPDGRWIIPGTRTKNGRSHEVLLPKAAQDLVKEQIGSRESGYLFATEATADGHLRSDSLAKFAKEYAKVSITMHLARHSLLTWAAERGYSKDVRDRLVNHVDKASGADWRYVKAQHTPAAKAAWKAWSDAIDTKSSKVASITGRRRKKA